MLFICLYFYCTLPHVIKTRWAHSLASTSPAPARDKPNQHGLLEKRRSIDEQVTLFPGGRCTAGYSAGGHAEWAHISRYGIDCKRGCWPAYQCCQCCIRRWEIG